MAEPSLITNFATPTNRRRLLAGGALVLSGAALSGTVLPGAALKGATLAIPSPARAGGTDSDAAVARLADRYRRAISALTEWIGEAERLHGPFAYEEHPAYTERYRALCALDDVATAALARARPATVRGLVLKLRPAFYCDSLADARMDCDTTVLMPALRDLERLAGTDRRAA